MAGGGGPEADDEESGEREVLRVRAPTHVKAKWGNVKRTLRRVVGEWLPTETCAELVAAEVLSAIRREVDPEALPPLAQCRAARRRGTCTRITCCSARRAAATRTRTSRRSALPTTSAASTPA